MTLTHFTKLGLKAGIVLIVMFVMTTVSAPQASALSGSDFQAGRIIDDGIFFNPGAMTVPEIQAFLNAKVPTCDNWGAQAYSGTTRAAYSQARGEVLPLTCLKDYWENPTTKENNLQGRSIPVGAQSAAQIIWSASQEYGISPKVLIVLLQKEQTLITDDWPWFKQYRSATGYGCPDTAPCDAQYYGFYNQVNNTARQFRRYAQQPDAYRHMAGRNNTVLFSPNSSCGSSSVYIQNQATAGLYNYTPYQPNQAALNNLYGSGDACSAYGNRNFWRIFNDWFGTTYSGVLPVPVSLPTVSTSKAGVGQLVTVSYSVTNPFNYALTLPSLGVSNRMNGGMYDFGIMTNVTFAANETRTFTSSFYPWGAGVYSLRVSYNFTGQWHTGGATTVTSKMPQLGVQSGLGISPEFPLTNQQHTVAFSIRNTGDVVASLPIVMVANLNGTTPAGYKFVTITLDPGQSYSYSDVRTLTNTTSQKSWVAIQYSDGSWAKLGGDLTYRAYTSAAAPKVIESVRLDQSSPVINTPVTATFKVRNTGDQPIRFNNIGLGVTRSSDSARFDFNSQPNGGAVLIPGNSEYTYKATRTFPTKDTYSVAMANSLDGVTWGSYIPAHDANVLTATTFTTYNSPYNIQVSPTITATPSVAQRGQLVTLSYKVKNLGDQPTGPMQIAFYCRLNTFTYCDIPGVPINLSSGQEQTLTRVVSFQSPGQYKLQPLKFHNGAWQEFSTSLQLTVNSYTPSTPPFTVQLTMSQTTGSVGQPITSTLRLTNTSPYDLQIPRYAVAARLGGQFYDYNFNDWFFIASGETRIFTSTFTPTRTGTYQLFPVMNLNGQWYGFSAQNIVIN